MLNSTSIGVDKNIIILILPVFVYTRINTYGMAITQPRTSINRRGGSLAYNFRGLPTAQPAPPPPRSPPPPPPPGTRNSQYKYLTHHSSLWLPHSNQQLLQRPQRGLREEKHGLLCVATVTGQQREEETVRDTADGQATLYQRVHHNLRSVVCV